MRRPLLGLVLALPAVGAEPDAQLDPGAPRPDVPVASATPPPGPGSLPPEVARTARDLRHADLATRVEALSALWLDVPYQVDPAGEGVPPDRDPPGRYDAFDCLTFVEEVMSVALAPDPAGAGAVRHALRYGDAPATHADRRHFMEAEWLPGAVADGWLVDTTTTWGETVRVARALTPEVWAAWRHRDGFLHPDSRLPTGTIALDVLPLETARAAAPRWPTGSLVVIVRAERPDVPFWVTHLGLVIGGERPRIRHASRMRSALRVRDNDLVGYLDLLATTYRRWPVVGVAVFEMVPQGPPRAAPAPISPR